jgi:serine protease Do
MMIEAVIRQVKGSVLCLEGATGGGTGFVISDHGHILTCNHVVPEAEVTVVSAGGDRWTVPILARQPATDLALLQIANFAAPPLRLADPSLITEGQTVVALGHPYGLNFTVSRGVVSSRNRVRNGCSYVQTDVSLNPGNSGGPVMNERGEVVGVATAVLADSRIGFAIALRHILAFAAQLRVPVSRASEFRMTETP